MSASFLDTNVLVYAFDAGNTAKQERALALLATAASGELHLSTQVLQEFYVAVTRKLSPPLPAEDAERAVRAFARFPLVQVDAELIFAAMATHRGQQISFWDALVVEAARAAGCATLLTEDLQDGRQFGSVTVENPFTPRAST